MTIAPKPPATHTKAPYRTAGGRVFNFNAGPSILPEDVIRQIQQDVWDYKGSGFGILEHSHRAKWYDELLAETFANVRQAGEIPSTHKILFMTGGSTSQNVFVPLNLVTDKAAQKVDYIDTDYWSMRSIEDARQAGYHVHEAFTGKASKYNHIPSPNEIRYSDHPAYIHMTTNNTIYGTEWATDPVTPAGVPLVADMCSDIFSRPVDWAKYAIAYASAQKNIGTTGATIVIIREDVLDRCPREVPRMFQYRTMVKEESRPNTPPHFAIYTVGLMAQWIIKQGGVGVLAKRNQSKVAPIYAAIDESEGFYQGHARADSRSLMNVTFRLGSDQLDDLFMKEALAAGMDGLKGHRATGGMRASTYNAFPKEGCDALAEFMHDFRSRHG